MNGAERVKSVVRGAAVDHRAFMPISMTLAADEVGAPYRDYAMDWRVQVRGQLAFAEAFGADHLSVISDPGVEAADLGSELVVSHNEPPGFDDARSLLADKGALVRLTAPGGAASALLGSGALRPGPRMENRLRALDGLAAAGRGERLMEGWVEGPCAEAADLRGLSRLMMDFFDDPPFVGELLDLVTELETAFAKAQVAAGADLIGVGDAASSLIGPGLFSDFVAERHKRYVRAIHEAGALARLHICGNTTDLLPRIGELGYDLVDLDFMVDLGKARAALGAEQVLTGNLDPVRVLRNGDAELVTAGLAACAAAAGGAWVVGAGCEIPRGTPRANILAMRDFARGGG